MTLELSSLKKALDALDRVLQTYQDILRRSGDNSAELEAIRAGVIQNFEVGYELCWKFMKRWVEENVPDVAVGIYRRELFRIGAENYLIDDVDEWTTFHKARNLTSHTYDEDNAKHVFQTALLFLPKAKDFLTQLEKRND